MKNVKFTMAGFCNCYGVKENHFINETLQKDFKYNVLSVKTTITK